MTDENFLGIREIRLDEFILSHMELAKRQESQKADLPNAMHFAADLLADHLERYRGTFVAYQKGVLCAQSQDRENLARRAESYFGTSSLDIFQVPKSGYDAIKCMSDTQARSIVPATKYE